MKLNPENREDGPGMFCEDFLQTLSRLKGFDPEAHYPDAQVWIDEKIAAIEKHPDYQAIAPYVEMNWDRLGEAFYFAYICHFGQKRKSNLNEIYAEHLFYSLLRFIGQLREEYAIRPPPEGKRVSVTDESIKIILHDTLEDFAGTSEKMEFYPAMLDYLRKKFGGEITDDIALVSTNFSERPQTVPPSYISEERNPVLQKMEASRLDFVALLLGVDETRDAVNLLLKVAERRHNLETADKMPNVEKKATESANLALACYTNRMRTPAKRLFSEFFQYLFKDNPGLFDKFKDYVENNQKWDEALFEETVQSTLQNELQRLLGHNRFEVQLSPLPLWRVNAAFMDHPQFVKRAHRSELSPSLPLITDEILHSEDFQKLIEGKFLFRIIVITENEEDAKLIWKKGLPSFHSEVLKNFGPITPKERGLLESTGYQARQALGRFLSHPQQLQFKIVDRETHAQNEFGKVEYSENPDGTLKAYYHTWPLERFIEIFKASCENHSRGSFEKVKAALLTPEGTDLRPLTEEIRGVIQLIMKAAVNPFINTLGLKKVWEVEQDIKILKNEGLVP